ncbi:hypothetical protein PF002_g30529 [Phytophthora fragariae]|uniref:Uncharacterized protein n=1 Tax=Phytophthora fragariae TaxID=53985 RepID=A0A6A3VK03_9STRA|nr:hypothetical protein PF002_g30529 [Phytophthora fragariae]
MKVMCDFKSELAVLDSCGCATSTKNYKDKDKDDNDGVWSVLTSMHATTTSTLKLGAVIKWECEDMELQTQRVLQQASCRQCQDRQAWLSADPSCCRSSALLQQC